MRMRMLTLQRRVNSGKRPPVCHVQQTFNEPGMADATVFKLQDGTSSLSLKSMFSYEERCYLGLAGIYCNTFVITETFRGLLKTLNDNVHRKMMYVFKGPKGVGKSAALGALAALCTWPTVVYSLRGGENHLLLRYQPSDEDGATAESDESPPKKKPNHGDGECGVRGASALSMNTVVSRKKTHGVCQRGGCALFRTVSTFNHERAPMVMFTTTRTPRSK